MLLSEHKRNIKGYSFVKVISMVFQSLFNMDSMQQTNKKSMNKHFFSNEQSSMNEKLSDYTYNRGLYR